ncbi:hypothetical protein L1987_69085 [Smallanthus sonchifolius]|uniref:Uncharacterized protein n=1 Tax=Smallanthus sonchifolius TaxID=185202 RepID=A0ACB9B5H7_9ASTR|nr:hypothetical protein L1987_69085 [Smallanthus sonchifolius]
MEKNYEPPRKKLKLKIKKVMVKEDNEIYLPISKKLKLKLPKDVSKKTPKTFMHPEFARGKKPNMHPEDKDDDDYFVTPPSPKAISKTPQPKMTNTEISRCKSAKQPEAQLYNQYYEFTGKKILPRIAPSNLINWFATFNDDQKRTINEMGFKPVLNLKLDNIPIELAFLMVQKYNAYTSTLNVRKQLSSVPIHEKRPTGNTTWYKVMGIPLGTIPIQEKRASEAKEKWRKKTKGVKNKTKQTKDSTILEDNLDSNTKQLMVLEEDDRYDAISQIWMNHYTPPKDDDKHIKEQFDAKDESENVGDKNEEDNVSLEATETDHEKNKMTCLLASALVEYEECFNRVHRLVSKAVEGYPNEFERRGGSIKIERNCIGGGKHVYTRDMAMHRIEGLENMLKQLKLERDLEEDIKHLCNEDLETKSVEKADEEQIEEWDFLYKTNRFCMKRRNGSIFYLKSIKELLDLPIGDLKQMIHLKEVGKDISSKENDTILFLKKFIFDEENIRPKYDPTPYNETLGESKEKCDEVRTSKKIIHRNHMKEAMMNLKKTLLGSRIGVSNVQSPLTITVVEKEEYDVGNKQREERNRKLSERFCSPYVDKEVSLTEKITGLE